MKKKTIIGLTGGVLAVAGLGAAVFLLLQSDSTAEESTAQPAESSTGEAVSLTAQQPDDVTRIEIDGANGAYAVVRTAPAAGDSHAVFSVEGYQDLPQDTDLLWTLPNNTASLTSTDVVAENAEDLTQYGLDNAQTCRVKLSFADGTDYAFRIGDTVDSTGATYVVPEDSRTVYTVSSSFLLNFSKSAEDFLSLIPLEDPGKENMPVVNYLTVDRTDMDYTMRMDYTDTGESADDATPSGGTAAAHEMTEPITAYLSVDRSTPVITGLFGAKAQAVKAIHPDEAAMTEYGLDKPFGTVVMDCADGNHYEVNFSKPYTAQNEDGSQTACVDVMLSGIDAVYQFSQADFVWADVTPVDIASKLVFATYVWNLGELDVTCGGEQFSFRATGDSAETAQVTLNGEATDAERYRQFYSFLLNTTAETVELKGDLTGEVLASIHIATQDGSFTKDVKFYALDETTCVMSVDGRSAFTCRRSFLQTLQENMGIYDSTQEFKTNWS